MQLHENENGNKDEIGMKESTYMSLEDTDLIEILRNDWDNARDTYEPNHNSIYGI